VFSGKVGKTCRQNSWRTEERSSAKFIKERIIDERRKEKKNYMRLIAALEGARRYSDLYMKSYT
jgi:hypothetical protein